MVFITRDLPREAIERTLAAFEGAVPYLVRSTADGQPKFKSGDSVMLQQVPAH